MATNPRSLFCAVVIAMALTASLSAQTTGAIEGRILASDGSALARASVTATGGVPGSRVVETDAAGRFYLAALPPGTYRLRVTITGFGAQQWSVIVSLGATTRTEFQLMPAVSEQTTVVASSPLVDTRSAEVGNTVGSEAFSRIPLGRDYTSIALFQPGVTSDNIGFSVLGATGLENAYFLDGVNVTGVRTGGETTAVPEEFLQEVQVRTATYEAEFGGATGGLVNAITRSGGNEFHGDVFGYFENDSLQAKAKSDVVGGNFAGFTNHDYGLGIGGYLLRDRLWFFGVYDRTTLQRDIRLLTGSGSPYDGSLFRSQDQRADLYAMKLTWTVSQAANVVGSAVGNPSSDAQQLVVDGPQQSRQIHESAGGPSIAVIATGTGSRWLGQLGLFDHRERRSRTPDFVPPFLTTDDNAVPTLDLANCALPGCTSGAPWVFLPTAEPLLRENYERRQARGSVSGSFGTHLLKAGAEESRITGTVHQSIPSGYNRILSRTADGMVFYTQSWFGDETGQYGSSHAVADVSGSPRTDALSLYAQDSWTPYPALSIDAGLRYEAYRLRDAVTGSSIADMKNNLAPRLGVAWDRTGRGTDKVTFAYGRFFQPIPMNHQAGSFRGTSIAVTDIAGFSFDCGPTAGDCQSYPNRFAEPADPHLRPPETEQVTLGYEVKVREQTKFGVRGLYSNLLRAVEDRCDLRGNDAAYLFTGNGCVLMNPGLGDYGRGLFPQVPFPDGSMQSILCTNGFNQEEGRASGPCVPVAKARRKYQAIVFDVEQRFSSDSYLLASYVWSRLRGNYDGEFNELGQNSPNTNVDYDFPGLLQNAYGKLANDRPHQVKVTGFHRIWPGVAIGWNAYYRSGTPKDRLGSFALVNGAPVPLYLDPRGSDGRTPADWDTDLHVDYTLPLHSGIHVSLIADAFRLFNRQTILRTNPFWNFDGFQSDNVVQTNPAYGTAIARAEPRLVRVGLRATF